MQEAEAQVVEAKATLDVIEALLEKGRLEKEEEHEEARKKALEVAKATVAAATASGQGGSPQQQQSFAGQSPRIVPPPDAQQ